MRKRLSLLLRSGLVPGLTLLAAGIAASVGACTGPNPDLAPAADPAAGPPGSEDTSAPGSMILPCTVGSSTDPLVARTSRGLLRGKIAGDTVAFLGIPYAAPPTGSRRFRPPAAAACWDGVRPATDYGPACPQQDFLSGKPIGQEDCLSLNVWAPRSRPTGSTPLPVLFFIHGGANILGASNQQILGNLYDGQDLAEKQGAVVVTVNYRIGALGFLAHPALTKESPKGSSGNYALLDQIAALTWVKENIAAFNGDPSRVLLFGESAGAFATCALIASPLAKGLFSAALMQSGACAAPSLKERERRGQEIAKTLGCESAADVAACLRQSSIENLVATHGSISIPLGMPVDLDRVWDLNYGAAVDGYVLPDAPSRMIKAGRHNHVPLALGTNANEMELFLQSGTPATCADYERMVRTAFVASASEVLRLYPCGLFPRYAMVDVLTDLFFTCPARRVARAAAASQTEPVYRYYFTHAGPGALSLLRAAHAMELPFVFHSFLQIGVIPNLAEEALSRGMQGYWARLAATGDPNRGGQPYWERYAPGRDNVLVFDSLISSRAPIRSEQCRLWDSLTQD